MSLRGYRKRNMVRAVSIVVLVALLLATTGIGYAAPKATVSSRRAPAGVATPAETVAPKAAVAVPTRSVVRKVKPVAAAVAPVLTTVVSQCTPPPPEPEDYGWIHVYKWVDYDGDQIWDNGEPAKADWRFTVSRPGKSWTLVTDASGHASVQVKAGSYTVTEEARVGWSYVSPKTAFLGKVESDVSRSSSSEDEDDDDEDCGPEIKTVSLYFGNHETTLTKSFKLSYPGAPSNATFSVVVKGLGTPVTVALSGGPDYTGQLDMPWKSKITVEWWITTMGGRTLLGKTGQECLYKDITNEFEYDSSVSGLKFDDLNDNGVRDAGEPGLSGWTIRLYPVNECVSAASVSAIAEVVTGQGGAYSFEQLPPGEYRVEEVLQDGWRQTLAPEGHFCVSNGVHVTDLVFGNTRLDALKKFELRLDVAKADVTYSVDYTINGETKTTALASGADPLLFTGEGSYKWGDTVGSVSWYALYGTERLLLGTTQGEVLDAAETVNSFRYDPSMSGSKFNDLDGDSEWDEGEPGLAGWTIQLWRIPAPFVGDRVDAVVGPALYASTQTGADGSYTFTGMLPGNYFVSEVLQDGWSQKVAPEGSFEMGNGVHLTGLDFGNARLDVLKKFELRMDVAKPDVTYSVDYTVNGDAKSTTLEPGADPLLFSGEGTYKWGDTVGGVSWYALYGSERLLLGTTLGEELAGLETVNSYDYASSIAGSKFNDADADGEWDEGEAGLEGWTIQLWRVPAPLQEVGIRTAVTGQLYDETVTGSDGSYSFSGALPGDYYVTEVLKDGWQQTSAPVGTFAVSNGTSVSALDFGNTRLYPDLRLEKSVATPLVARGDVISYTLTWENVGDYLAAGYTVTDDFDERYVSVVDAAGGIVSDGKIVWTFADPLAPGDAPMSVTYTLQVLDAVPEDVTVIDNVAVIEHPEDTDLTNNNGAASVEVEPFAPFTPKPDPTPEEEPFLPFTGADAALLIAIALASAALGLLLRRRSA